ncbi:MAG: transcription-repair coupling factor [Actinobacteria bacterium]|nr:transcription-repair coupling factor [Actinomycetota bacterium]
MQGILERIIESEQWQRFLECWGAASTGDVLCPSFSVSTFLNCFLRCAKRDILFISPSVEEAEDVFDESTGYTDLKQCFLIPPREFYPLDKFIENKESSAQRNKVLFEVSLQTSQPRLFISSARALLEKVPGDENKLYTPMEISSGIEMEMEELINRLVEFGFTRVSKVQERGEFAVRGGIVDVFDGTGDLPYRLEFDGAEVSSVRMFSISNQVSIRNVDDVSIFRLTEAGSRRELVPISHCFGSDLVIVTNNKVEVMRKFEEFHGTFLELLERQSVQEEAEALNLICKFDEIFSAPGSIDLNLTTFVQRESRRFFVPFVCFPQEIFSHEMEKMRNHVLDEVKSGFSVFFTADTRGKTQRLTELIVELDLAESNVSVLVSLLRRGFVLPELDISLYTEYELFGFKVKTKKIRQTRDAVPISALSDIWPGDYVVHINHGIGIFDSVVRQEVDGVLRDFFLIRYAEDDKLFVPTNQLSMLQAYIGDREPTIHRLGSARWDQIKSRVKNSVKKLAFDLLELYAIRERVDGYAFGADSIWQRELEQSFPYEETPDQMRAISDVKSDMERPRPMDRLVCGDVGYGKTEVAIRAAFKAIDGGKQVLMLVPTTILAEQHLNTFSDRFAPFPINIAVMSRLKSDSEQKRVLKDLENGAVDLVIGTHRLLQDDVRPKNLGLLIIDEEQRFGVGHKEMLKKFRQEVDVLTLTATPIPRTLYMAMSGIRDMSIINTPPEDRLSVLTYVGKMDISLIKAAIERELARDGQVFYVYNRISGIEFIAQRLRRLVPNARIAVAHGRLGEGELEKIMIGFVNRKIDVLVSTTIVESGLDIPSANTIVVERAQILGLSQLYQLRGRVGRAGERAHAYFFYQDEDMLSNQAFERLRTISEFSDLGSGFRIAMRDLEIRGAGNILGPEQHGYMASVGFELYAQLIKEAIDEIKGEVKPRPQELLIDVDVDAYISSDYIIDDVLRIEAYRIIDRVTSESDADTAVKILEDRYGPMPQETRALIEITRIRAACYEFGLTELKQSGQVLRLSKIAENMIDFKRPKALFSDFRYRKSLGELILTIRKADGLELLGELHKTVRVVLDFVVTKGVVVS